MFRLNLPKHSVNMHSGFEILQTKYLQMIHISGNISLVVTHVTGESPGSIMSTTCP